MFNDSEEWDGEKWVAKRVEMQDEITINGVTYVRKPVEKTNAERLKQYFARNIGTRITFSDFGSDVSTARVADASRTGNRVTVVYDAGE